MNIAIAIFIYLNTKLIALYDAVIEIFREINFATAY